MNIKPALCVLFLYTACINPLVAQEVTEKRQQPEIKTLTHTVVDEDGKPIVGARVVTLGMRSLNSGAWTPWPEEVLEIAELVTDEAGQVKVPYPVEFKRFSHHYVVEEVTLQTAHNMYVTDSVDCEVIGGGSIQTLVRGCQTRFTCVDENGSRIEEFGALIGGAGSLAMWSLKGGELSSGGVPNGKFQTMLVGIGSDGLPQFSGVLPTRYAKGKDVSVRGIKLQPGLRVDGKISANVPKPIEDGMVIAWCLPRPAGATHSDEDASIGWMEQCKIAADGTFAFQSLPRGGTIQFIALCNGYMVSLDGSNSANGITVDAGKAVPNDTLQVELPMGEAGKVEVLVLGPDDKPLVGARVSTWPNTKFNLDRSNLLGTCTPTIDVINYQIGRAERLAFNRPFKNFSPRYVTATNAEGIATLTEVPIDARERIFVSYPNLIPAEEGKKQHVAGNGIEITCESSTPIELTVRMVNVADNAE